MITRNVFSNKQTGTVRLESPGVTSKATPLNSLDGHTDCKAVLNFTKTISNKDNTGLEICKKMEKRRRSFCVDLQADLNIGFHFTGNNLLKILVFKYNFTMLDVSEWKL